jgi:hypothetical protein
VINKLSLVLNVISIILETVFIPVVNGIYVYAMDVEYISAQLRMMWNEL